MGRPESSEIRGILEELVEADHDRKAAHGRLEDFKANEPPPEQPVVFDGPDDLSDYHQRRQRYEADLGDRESNLKAARTSYAGAEERLRGVLPQNTALYYTYEGDREHLRGTLYEINYTRDGISVHDRR